jgi:hypothetical protein
MFKIEVSSYRFTKAEAIVEVARIQTARKNRLDKLQEPLRRVYDNLKGGMTSLEILKKAKVAQTEKTNDEEVQRVKDAISDKKIQIEALQSIVEVERNKYFNARKKYHISTKEIKHQFTCLGKRGGNWLFK